MGDSLSQSTETFTENVKSVHYQVCVWQHMLDSDPLDMNFGLLHEKTIKTPSPVIVPHGIPSIPLVTEDILHFLKCYCHTQKPYGTIYCGCDKAWLGCTVYCVCQKCIVCKRMNIETSNSASWYS